jgi:DNA-binding NarL/FixJ family response regulator
MTPYRIIIADDHALFRQIEKILRNSRVEVIGGKDGLELFNLLRELTSGDHPRYRCPSGLEAIHEIRRTILKAKC